jgi:hypothetical protein
MGSFAYRVKSSKKVCLFLPHARTLGSGVTNPGNGSTYTVRQRLVTVHLSKPLH